MTDPESLSAGPLLAPVLADLAEVVGAVRPAQLDFPTPCAEYDVAALRGHVLSWLAFFAVVVEDPAGETERPDPSTIPVPDDAAAGAALVREVAARIAGAVASGVAERPVKIQRMSLPGEQALRMMLWEYLTHGSDLARAIGHPWEPAPTAAEVALTGARGMMSDEYRGVGKDFGEAVPVPDDAPALERLLGFSGRDPHWKS
jgi:uncharacterized protein (TIGR03086 family)